MSNPRIRIDEYGEQLDDFMATNVSMLHFEALDAAQWYLTVELINGQVWQLHFGAKNPKAHGYARAERIL